MRDWIADCQWRDLDGDEIAELTPAEMAKGIERNYDGGMRQFLADAEPVEQQEEPEIDDSVKCCPGCETPNQFGEICMACQRDMAMEETHLIGGAE